MKFKSALVTQVSGSIGGLTGSHNRGGLYMRARAVPVNPGTMQQGAIRAAITSLASAWNEDLDEAQREGWRTYGANVTITDALGDARHLTGQQHFVRSNAIRLQLANLPFETGLDRVDDAPQVFDLGTFTTPSVDLNEPTGGAAEVSFGASDAWTGETGSAMILFQSRQQNPGIQFFKGPYRLMGTIRGDGGTAPTSPEIINQQFPVDDGNRSFFAVRVSRADGRLSGLVRISALA